MSIKLIMYVVGLVICKVFAIIYEWTEMEIVFRTLVVIGVTSIISCIISFFRIKVNFIIENDRVVKGKDLQVNVLLDNKSILPATILRMEFEIENELNGIKTNSKVNIPVKNWGKQSFVLGFKTKCCGNTIVKIKRVRFTDLLDLLRLKKRVNVSGKVPVIPGLSGYVLELPVKNNAVVIDSDNYSKEKPGDDPSEVFEIRQMHQGDTYRKINWKASMRKQEYMVNEYSMPQGEGIVILVDNCINNDLVDEIFTNVNDLAINLIQYEKDFELVWYNFEKGHCETIKVRPNDSLAEIYSKMYECGIYTGESKIANAYNTEYENIPVSHLYYVTTNINKQIIENMYNNRKHSIMKIYINKKMSHDIMVDMEYCHALGIEVEVRNHG